MTASRLGRPPSGFRFTSIQPVSGRFSAVSGSRPYNLPSFAVSRSDTGGERCTDGFLGADRGRIGRLKSVVASFFFASGFHLAVRDEFYWAEKRLREPRVTRGGSTVLSAVCPSFALMDGVTFV
jgi:hypothetical protein